MKVLSVIGMILAILGLVLGLLNQFSFIPYAATLEGIQDAPDSYVNARLWAEAHSFTVFVGEITLLVGGLGFILAGIPAIKIKSKVALIGAILGLVALVLGLAQGTHMFS